jgi:hypothetical protein
MLPPNSLGCWPGNCVLPNARRFLGFGGSDGGLQKNKRTFKNIVSQ